jgi:hypothetical protein
LARVVASSRSFCSIITPLNHSLGLTAAVRAKYEIHVFVKLGLTHQLQFKERESGKQFRFRRRIRWKAALDQQDAINIIRFHYIGDKTAVQNNPSDSGTPGYGNHPRHRFDLGSPDLGSTAETRSDFCESRRVNAGRQVTGMFKRWDHIGTREVYACRAGCQVNRDISAACRYRFTRQKRKPPLRR